MASDVLTRNNVRIVGDGPGVVVLAHGYGSDQEAWGAQVEALSSIPGHRIVLFDHVGCGGSDLSAYSSRRYGSLHPWAEDLLEILGEIGAWWTVYVGHSMSGMVGLLAAQMEPKRFSRMAWLGASPRYLNDDGYVGGFRQADVDGLYAAMEGDYHAWATGFGPVAMGNPERPELGAYFARSLASMRPDISLGMARVIFQSDYRPLLPLHRVQTLVVQSKDDVAVPSCVGEYLATNLPSATLAQVDAHGHLPHVSAPEAVDSLLKEFVVR